MGYADGLLTSGERVVHREKQHWWVFIWGAKWTILAMIAALLLLILSNGMESGGFLGTIKTLLGWVAAAVFIGGIALLFWTILSYLSQEYVVTNRRVIDTQGVVNKRAADSSLEKINDAVLTQSVFGRALDFGDLKILTASEAAISEFRMLRRPIEFKKAMLEAKHEYEIQVSGGTQAPSPPLRADSAASSGLSAAPAAALAAAGTPVGDDTVSTPGVAAPAAPAAATGADADDITRTLSSLADLRDRGAITPEEYERKKAELLGRL
jgi:Bacterial PH domain/Short C-terminal domain